MDSGLPSSAGARVCLGGQASALASNVGYLAQLPRAAVSLPRLAFGASFERRVGGKMSSYRARTIGLASIIELSLISMAACTSSSPLVDGGPGQADAFHADRGASDGPVGDGSTPTSCEAHAAQACAAVSGCNQFLALYGSQTACLKTINYLCVRDEQLPVGWGVADATACHAARRAQRSSCDPNKASYPAPCAPRGSRALGERCSNAYQCASGACKSDGQGCGTCVEAVPEGQSCSSASVCAWGAICRNNVCEVVASAGDGCDDKGCVFYPFDAVFACVGGTCTLADVVGSYVGQGGDCSLNVCAGDARCNGSVCLARSDVGEPCRRDNINGDCLRGLVCDRSTERCALPYQANMPQNCP